MTSPATAQQVLIELTDLELQAELQAGTPGAETEYSMRAWCTLRGWKRAELRQFLESDQPSRGRGRGA